MAHHENPKSSRLLVGLLLLVLFIWGGSALVIIFTLDSWDQRGTFGDLFGAVNALFSALAFAALIYTIILQRETIEQNRQEIIKNRKGVAKGAKLQEKSYAVLEQQMLQTHLTAKMNAMQILVEYYNNQISNPNSTSEIIDLAKEKRKKVIKKIDFLIDDLDDSEAE